MFSLYGAKKQAVQKKAAVTCPKNKDRCKEVCSKCEDSQFCPAAPSLEYVEIPEDLRSIISCKF